VAWPALCTLHAGWAVTPTCCTAGQVFLASSRHSGAQASPCTPVKVRITSPAAQPLLHGLPYGDGEGGGGAGQALRHTRGAPGIKVTQVAKVGHWSSDVHWRRHWRETVRVGAHHGWADTAACSTPGQDPAGPGVGARGVGVGDAGVGGGVGCGFGGGVGGTGVGVAVHDGEQASYRMFPTGNFVTWSSGAHPFCP
jgi:hypothetical protein